MKHIYFTVFLVSCSLLMFEISLTRIFSISLWYHFAFMVISIAMLGIGGAGTFLTVYARTRNFPSESSPALYAALSGIAVIGCYLVSNHIPFDPVKFSWEKMQFIYLALYCLVLSVPFFFGGLLLSTAFLRYSERSGPVYSADLIGAGMGAFAALALLDMTGPEYIVLCASTLCLAGAAITGKRNIRILALIFISVNLLLFSFYPELVRVKISPYKSLSLYLKYPGAKHLKTFYGSYARIDVFKSPAVRLAPGLSLRYLDNLPDQLGLAIDADRVDAITKHDKPRLAFLKFLPSSLAYEIGNKDRVLVIDPGGGLHALMAEYYGAKEIHKTESNPMIIKVIRENFSSFSGNIFSHNTWTGYARNFLRGLQTGIAEKGSVSPSGQSYDLIDMPLTDTSVSGFFGISEDYRYTVEAFGKYIGALKKDGIMSISFYLIPPPRTEFKILATVNAALEQAGIRNAFNRIVAIRSWDSMTMLVKKSPFTESEINQIKAFSEKHRFDLVYFHGIRKEESNKYIKMYPDEYFEGFKKLIEPETRTSFINNYLFDIKPVHDDNPFFHYYLKLGNIKKIYERMGQKWLYFLEEGYILPLLFATVIILSAVIIFIPFASRYIHKKSTAKNLQAKPERKWGSALPLLYFSMLGTGFMFIEVSLLQKSILLFENPVYATAVVLTSILISSGAGSFVSSKVSRLTSPYSLTVLTLFLLIYSLIHPLMLNLLAVYTLKTKILIMTASLIPIGFFMGIPFPMGMKILGKKDASLIPWAWAVNACMSVLAPILTIMIALLAGFKTVLWLGAISYLVAFISLRRLLSH